MINVFRHTNKLLHVPSEGGRATGGAGCSFRLVVPCEDSHHNVFSLQFDKLGVDNSSEPYQHHWG